MRKAILLLCGLFAFVTAFAQTRQVTGKVVDKKGEALIGVSVGLKGSSTGVSTDVSGNFKINVPTSGSSVLVFKYVGFKTKEVSVGQQSKLSVTLEESSTELDAVVVVGYGTAKKKDLTGAVGTVTSDVIAAAPVTSAMQAIQGRVAGVQISSTEGSPDATMTVRVRGGGSITQSNEPLYIIDGFPGGSIADIAPADIESISILKDASSTAIYGSRGANGVVLVTTKNSKNGKTNVSYNVFGGPKKMANQLGVLSPYDYVNWQYERSLLDNGNTDDYTKYFGNYQDMDLYSNVKANDWQDLVFGRTGSTFNQNLSITGGGEKTKFAVSHNFVKDNAIMILSGYERQNVNFKLNQKLYNKLTLDLGARYADTKIKGGGANEQKEVSSADSRLKYIMIYPNIPVAGLTSSSDTDPDFNLFNPIQSINDNNQSVHRKNYNLNGALNWEIVKDLKLRSEVGYDGTRTDQDRFYGKTTYYVHNIPAAINQGLPAIIFTNSVSNSFRSTNTLNYDFSKFLGKDHTLNMMLGQEFIKTQNNTLTTTVHGFPTWMTFDKARVLSTQGADAFSIDNNFSPDDKLLSFFGRANYDYKGKYLVTATMRADGSSKFSAVNHWGYFPSVSGAWRISSEPFMEGTKDWLNDWKFRASYGESGNNGIPAGQIIQSYGSAVTSWVNNATNYWAPSKVMANPNLKWETTISRNIGMDFTLFHSTLSGTVDAYRNNVKDLLINFPTGGTGYDSEYINLGKTRNQGVEISLNWNALKKKNFDLTLNGNISINRNKVINIGSLTNISASSGWASSDINADYLVQVGAPIGRIYGFQSDGRYEVSDFTGYDAVGKKWILKDGVAKDDAVVGTIRPGTMKLKDLDGNGIVDQSDKTIIGNTNPKHVGGFSLNARLYNFDLGAYFNWSYGNDEYNANKIEYTSTSKYSSREMISMMESGQRWTNLRADGTISNDPAELEAMNANTTLWSPLTKQFILSDWAVEDGSFLRLSTLSLGYTVPKSISNRLKMKTLRVYASGYNVWLLTNYTGFDPEASTRRQTNLTPNVDYSAYPRSRSLVFGLNVNF